MVLDVRPVTADADVDVIPALGVLAERLGQGDELERQLLVDVVRRDAGRQGDPLGLGAVLADAELQVRSERAALEQHVLVALGVVGDRHVADVAFPQDLGQHVAVEVGRRDVGRQGGRERLPVDLALDVRPVASDAHHVRLPALRPDRGDLTRVDGLEALLDAADDAVLTEVEVAEVALARATAGGDVVEDRLHAGGELRVDEAPELVLEQVVGRERGERRDQLLALLAHVAAVLDGVDDARVGAGPADAFGLEELDQRGVGEAGGRLGLVTDGLHVVAAQRVAFGELGERLVTVVERGVGIVGAFDVRPEEPGEEHGAAARAEAQLAVGERRDLLDEVADVGELGVDAGRDELQARVGHLRGHGALPDQVVERCLAALQPVLVGGLHLGAGRPDRLVGLLGVARALLEGARLGGEEPLAVATLDRLARRRHGLLREVYGVGAHVRDVAVLVERLRDAHGVLGRQAELPARLLLQCRGGERRRGGAGGLALLHRVDGPPGVAGAVDQRLGRRLVERHHRVALCRALLELAGVGVVIAALGDAHPAEVGEGGLELRAVLGQGGGEVPIGGRHERQALLLAHDEEAHGHALDPAGREPRGDLAPQQRADGVADQTVEHAPGLLRVDQARVDRARVLERVEDRLLGDLVEDHAPHGHLRLEQLDQVPADRLALAVLVRRDVELVGVLERGLELLDDVLLARRDDVHGLEALVDVHPEASPALALDIAGDLGSG